jgi:hypothetical protein
MVKLSGYLYYTCGHNFPLENPHKIYLANDEMDMENNPKSRTFSGARLSILYSLSSHS